MTVIAQAIAGGILLGGLYAVLALGFSLVWQTNRVINLAYGELAMLGAYITWGLWWARWLDPMPALLLVMPIMFGIGFFFERLLLRPLASRRVLASLLTTLGLAVVVQQSVRVLFSPTPHTLPPPATGLWRVGAVHVSMGRATLLLVSLTLVAAVVSLLKGTRVGRSIRATGENPDAAHLMGIEITRIRTITFGLSTAIAGAAGVLAGQAQPIHPFMGPPLLLRAIAITALVGRANVGGAVAGGVALGVLESLVAALVPRIGSSLGVIAACVVLVAALTRHHWLPPRMPPAARAAGS